MLRTGGLCCFLTLRFNILFHGVGFNKICGRIKAFQKGSIGAFNGFSDSPSLNSGYCDGISITVGNPRKHIRIYAAGHKDDSSNLDNQNCPCAVNPGIAPPSFVGEHYYCESRSEGGILFNRNRYYTDDPLWDGAAAGCSFNNNCYTNADQPWFFRQFISKRQDNIEARLCTNKGFQMKLYWWNKFSFMCSSCII